MTYGEAIKKGLGSFKEKERRRAEEEISSILGEASREISAVMGVPLKLHLSEMAEQKRQVFTFYQGCQLRPILLLL